MAVSEPADTSLPTAPWPPGQRLQSRRLHPLTPFLDLFDRNLVAPGVIAFGSGGLRIAVAALVALALFRTLSWSRRTWVLDEGVLHVTSGVLARNTQLVPCDRIQQVNLVQKLRHRLFGVASLRVEVAGGGRGSGVELDVLGIDAADELRSQLLAAKAEAVGATNGPNEREDLVDQGDGRDEGPRWVPTAWPVVHLGMRQLVLAGLTGSELLVLFAFVASATQLLGDLPEGARSAADGLQLDLAGPVVTVVLLLGFLVLWLGSAVATSVFRDAGYTLDLVGDELHLSRGLLDRKEAVLPLARVQSVQITASPLRRPLGYVSVRVQSASAGTEQDDRRVSVPILHVDQLPAVLELLLPGSAALEPLRPAPKAARRRAIVRSVVPAVIVSAPLAVLAAPLGLLALAVVPLAAWFGVLTYRGLGHAVGASHLLTRSGAVVRRTVVVPLVRAQSTRLRSSVFQRRLGLASCTVDIAGSGRRPAAVDVELAAAAEVADRVVAAVGGR